ncbi:MAG: hypothetical protein IKM04_01010 [Clostridia bacterium]|nr:hypothetical protein [Clostridia bacterium]
MSKISYLFKRVFHMDYGRLARTVKATAEKAGRSRIYIAYDMFRCATKYMAAPADYDLFEFYSLTPDQRETYVTRGINNLLVKKFNDRSLWHIFDNKDEFNTLFAKYIGRDWMKLEPDGFERFADFIEGRTTVFYKPTSLSCGWGIEKIDLTSETDTRALFDRLIAKGGGLIEEQIRQHPEMDRMYSGSVNTIRLVTINDGESVEIVFAFLRVGNGRIVDNLNSGGMAAPIDPQSGRVTHPAADKDYKAYDRHPATDTEFVGFEIPRFAEAVAMVKEAATVEPRMGYVGWDVAITPDGLCLVEANSYPGHDILQLPPHVPEKIGLKPRIEKYINGRS